MTADEQQVYATNVASATVSLLANVLLQPTLPPTGKLPPGAGPHLEWVQTVIPVAPGSEGFDVSPDGKELWTAAAANGVISVINLVTRQVAATIDAKVLGANRLKFTPDGRRVLISSLRSGDLVIYDVASHKELKRLSLGYGAAGVLVDPDGSRAFVACSADDTLAIIDLEKLEVTGHLDVGGKPDGLAWAAQPSP